MNILMIYPPISITRLEDIEKSLDIISEIYYIRRENMMKPISLFQPVIAVAGTEIYDYVVENNLYANNGRGYRFKDERVEVYYRVIKKWAKLVDVSYADRFLVDKDDMYLKTLYWEIYSLDLSFMKKIVIDIKDEGRKEETVYDELINKEFKRLDSLIKEVKNIEVTV